MSFATKQIGKFILLLRKRIYLYEYMDNRNRFDETKLPSIDKVYSNLKLENITDSDCRQANRVLKEFKLKICVNIVTFMSTVILYHFLICLKTLETNVLNYMN